MGLKRTRNRSYKAETTEDDDDEDEDDVEDEFFVKTDGLSLYSHLQYQQRQLSLKRRWLMGLALSAPEQKRVNRSGILQEKKTLPESFLREDDVQYENLKAFVRKGFGAMNDGMGYHAIQENMWTFDFPSDIRKCISSLDEMSNNGLQLVAKVLTGGSLKVEKTRWKMKKFIKQHLPGALKNFEDVKVKMKAEQLCEILRNPQNFRLNILGFSSRSKRLHAAAYKILDGLEDLDSLTLSTMHRKLRGIQGYIPQLQSKRSEWNRSDLIDRVRKLCTERLSELGDTEELQEPLSKAMAVATLSSNLIQGCPSPVVFRRFSSEIVALQSAIAKAIWLLDGNLKNIRFSELNNLQIFLDPNAELSARSLRRAVKKFLMEFLFECSDLDAIPELLFKILSVVNQASRSAPYRFFTEEDIEEEVENVLSLSAQMKQISWDLLPEYKYGSGFRDAYMEDVEDSEDEESSGEDCTDCAQGILSENGNAFGSIEGYDKIEATGETSPIHFNDFSENLMDSSPTSLSFQVDSMDVEENPLQKADPTKVESSGPHLETHESNPSSQPVGSDRDWPHNPPDMFSADFSEGLCMKRNHYLDVQEACDNTSLVAYQLIGCLLEEFVEIEGFDFDSADASYLRGEKLSCNVARAAKEGHNTREEAAVRVLEELLPSFPKSGKEKVKQLMGLQ